MNINDKLFLIFLGFSLAVPLGPINMEMIKQTLANRKPKRGLITGIGAMTGDFTIALTILSIGTTLFISLLKVKIIISILILVNFLILMYFGISALRMEIAIPKNEELIDKAPIMNYELLSSYSSGLFLVITSPWSYFWWASFGPYIFTKGYEISTFNQKLVVITYFLVGIFLWISIMNSILYLTNKYSTEKIISRITKGSGIIIIIFGLKILLDGFCLFTSC
ncbi:MAG: LysE family transporter [Candidatus Heimdallarchaeota archaeon]|nr:LysE family transporter [Candidatus Heimdallarchaeota archaeon]MDH5646034.1 LysE family transporter [Candidatus Heimdallarchaeota archaeon]